MEFYWFSHKSTKAKQQMEKNVCKKHTKQKQMEKQIKKSEKGRLAYQIGEEEAEDGAVAAPEARTQ